MKHILEILAGPASFALTAFALTGTFTPAQSFAIGTAVWMALWWILRPVSIYVTAFIPILVDSFLDLIPEGHVLSQYFSEIAVPVKEIKGTRSYFQDMYKAFGPLKKGEWIGLILFLSATILAFARPAFAALLPGWKPAYIFLTLGLFMFFLKDETGCPMLTWKYAESHIMWGMICLFASGLALGRLVIETGAIEQLASLIAAMHLSSPLSIMAISCGFATFLSELSSNTAAASISIPVVTGLTKALGVNPIPYILGTIVAANCAYVLPLSTRAIPIGHGLDAAQQIKYGILLTLITLATTITTCTLFLMYSPLFSEL